MKKKKVLCDTNVISSYLIGLPDAVFLIKNIGFENVVISSITAMELQKWFWSYKGLTQDQISQFREILRLMQIIHIDRKTSALALGFYDNYKEASMQIPDMLIAATAKALKLNLYTLNIKDFKFIKGVKLYGVTK
jgi:predicted nucleic acid-binding protein